MTWSDPAGVVFPEKLVLNKMQRCQSAKKSTAFTVTRQPSNPLFTNSRIVSALRFHGLPDTASSTARLPSAHSGGSKTTLREFFVSKHPTLRATADVQLATVQHLARKGGGFAATKKSLVRVTRTTKPVEGKMSAWVIGLASPIVLRPALQREAAHSGPKSHSSQRRRPDGTRHQLSKSDKLRL